MAIKNKEMLQDLSTGKLMSYIFFLTQKYYVAYVQDDPQAYDFAVEHLFFIKEQYGDKYVNLDGFICYCLYLNGKRELTSGDKPRGVRLEPLFKMELLEDEAEELTHDIKNIFNKERIKERYEKCKKNL